MAASWEYHCVSIYVSQDDEVLNAHMQELASVGWELLTVVSYGEAASKFFWRRPLPQEPAD